MTYVEHRSNKEQIGVMNYDEYAWRYADYLGITKVPESYWLSRGHSHLYAATIMDQLQNDLMKYTCNLSHNMNDGSLVIGHYWKNEDDGSWTDCWNEVVRCGDGKKYVCSMKIVEYDDKMLPLWVAFTNALLAYSDEYPYHLVIFNVELTESVFGMLGHALEGKTIETLSLLNVGLGRSTIAAVAKIVRDNPTMVKLHLCGNDISDVNVATHLFSAVGQHPTLVEVWLENCSIGPEGARVIADVLKHNGRMQHINLSNNGLKDAGITHLAVMLKVNTSLRSIDLTKTGVSEGSAGFHALNTATFDTTNLNSVFGSNHTCHLELGHRIELPIQKYTKFNSTNAIRKRKIAYALGLNKFGTFKASLLDEFPMQLIPEMLVFVQAHRYIHSPCALFNGHQTTDAMTNLFEVLRDCVAPLLFVPQAKSTTKS